MSAPVTPNDSAASAAALVTREVLEPVKRRFVGKDVIIDLLGIALVAGENIFLHGPPGTAKSALVREVAQRVNGRVFDYLLTRFSEPNELFGPFDIRRLREGDLVTNTEGMLPEAEVVFLDELLNANSAILNSLLMVLNERVFRRGRETRDLPALLVVGASNNLPEDEALRALFDRFLLRVSCENVPAEMLTDVLQAGWRIESGEQSETSSIDADAVRQIQQLLPEVSLAATTETFVDAIRRLRHAGIEVSDRRAVKLQRLLAASALLCGRLQTDISDLWVLRHIWDTREQQSVLKAIIDEIVREPAQQESAAHPQARAEETVDADRLALDLEQLLSRVTPDLSSGDRRFLQDQVALLAERTQWVTDPRQAEQLEALVSQLWERLEEADE